MKSRERKALARGTVSGVDSSIGSGIASVIDRIAGKRVVVWGDFVADEFIHGEISRVSREAPVLILKHRRRDIVPGGGANAAANLAALGVKVTAVGAVGDDIRGERLLALFRDTGIDTRSVLKVRGRSTPTKTRILAGHAHTSSQQVIRIDEEPEGPLAKTQQEKLRELAIAAASKADALLVSDYGYGSVTPQTAAAARKQLAPEFPVTLDSRYDVLGYRGCTAATPNEPEVEEALHVKIGNDPERLEIAGRDLLERLGCRWLLITRGRDGMALFERGKKTIHIPIFGGDQAVDVTGAGDTVIATFTAALAAGAHGEAAARLANCAGGLVVMKRGTATVTIGELREAQCEESRKAREERG